MADSKFHGVIPPVVVPLDANRELDVPAFERLMQDVARDLAAEQDA